MRRGRWGRRHHRHDHDLRSLPLMKDGVLLRNLILGGGLAAAALILACDDEPVGPRSTKGLLVVRVTFEQASQTSSAISQGIGAVDPVANRPPQTTAAPNPSFSFAQLDAVEVTILKDGVVQGTVNMVQEAGGFRGTSEELVAGTYQVMVLGLVFGEVGEVTWFAQQNATVTAGSQTTATVTLRTFKPQLAAVALKTTALDITASWGAVSGADNYQVDFADNSLFTPAQSVTQPATIRTETFPVTSVGTYYVRVKALNSLVGTRGTFGDPASTEVVTDTVPSGSDAPTAAALGFGESSDQTLTGLNILPAGDIDWFSFDACSGDQVSVTVRSGSLATPSSLEAKLSLLDTDGTTLLAEDGTAGTGDKNVSATFTTESGTYFITVEGQGGGIGEYELTIDVAPGSLSNVQLAACVPNLGTRLLFVSDRDGNPEIYVRSADGTTIENITQDAAFDFWPRWSPDGLRLAFASDRGGDLDVYVMNDDGTGLTQVTTNPAEDFKASWFPDGTRIAWQTDRDGNQEIYIMDLSTGAVRNLTNDPSDDQEPVWSPHGDRIAFFGNRDGDNEIFVMFGDGTGLQQLTNNSADERWPSFSPDGSRIAFGTDRDGNIEIYVMDANGSNQVNLSNNASRDITPSWSDDGSRIVFSSDRDGDEEVYVMNSDGSEQFRVTNNPGQDFRPNLENPNALQIADLAPTSVTAPVAVLIGDSVDVSVVIENFGTVAALPGWTIDYYLSTDPVISAASDILLKTVQVNFQLDGFGASVGIGDRVLVSGPGLTPGQIYFGVIVDAGDDVLETDDSNNAIASANVTQIAEIFTGTISATVVGFADTVVLKPGPGITWTGSEDVTVQDAQPYFLSRTTDSIAFVVPSVSVGKQLLIISNQGTGALAQFDSLDVTSTFVPNTDPLTAPDISSGPFPNTFFISLSASSPNHFFTVAPATDLRLAVALDWQNSDDLDIVWKDSLFAVLVGNIDGATLSNPEASTVDVPGGVTWRLWLNWFSGGTGATMARVTLDSTQVTSMDPDLAVITLTAPDTALVDSIINLDVVVENQGGVVAPAGWDLEVLLSAGETGTSVSLGTIEVTQQINPGNTVNIGAGVTVLKPDLGYVDLVVNLDVNDEISETDESNNQIVANIVLASQVAYGFVFTDSLTAANDSIEIYVLPTTAGDGLMVHAIEDTASVIDPELGISWANGGFVGGNFDVIDGVTTSDSDLRIGSRTITGGEWLVLPVTTTDVKTIDLRRVAGAGRAQLVVQNCFIGANFSVAGQYLDAFFGFDCTTWPNPISGVQTHGVFVTFNATAGDSVKMDLVSTSAIDPTLFLFGPGGQLVDSDDDGGTGFNSLIVVPSLPETGTYTAFLSTFDRLDTGSFTFTIGGSTLGAPPAGVAAFSNTGRPRNSAIAVEARVPTPQLRTRSKSR